MSQQCCNTVLRLKSSLRIVSCNVTLTQWIGHFRIVLSLCLKARLRAKPLVIIIHSHSICYTHKAVQTPDVSVFYSHHLKLHLSWPQIYINCGLFSESTLNKRKGIFIFIFENFTHRYATYPTRGHRCISYNSSRTFFQTWGSLGASSPSKFLILGSRKCHLLRFLQDIFSK